MSSEQKQPVSTGFLICIPYPSDVGFAIKPLEKLFFETAVRLLDGDISKVHFAYSEIGQLPDFFPPGFSNLIEFNPNRSSPSDSTRFANYLKEKSITICLFFDLQPTHPLLPKIRKSGVKKIFSYWGAPISSVSSLWKRALKKNFLALASSKADALIFESHAMAELAIKGRGYPSSRIDVVPLGIDIQLFQPRSIPYAHSKFSIAEGRKIIFYAGHMEERKGVSILIQAVTELIHNRNRRDVQTLILGNRPGEEQKFTPLYSGLGIDDFFTFAGYRDDIPDILPSCYCGVIPSTGWDSFPRTALEIQASGIPIVASRLQGIPETLDENVTGLLFTPGSYQELANHLEYLLDNPNITKKMGRAARDRCVSDFSLDVQRENFYSVLCRRSGI